MKLVIGHCQSGSLTGAVASKKVTEAFKGSLRMVGNHSKSTKAKASLTARHTGRAETKVGLSDPVVPSGRAIAQRIKATPGITGLSPPRVHIDGEVWHLDVGSSHQEIIIVIVTKLQENKYILHTICLKNSQTFKNQEENLLQTED